MVIRAGPPGQPSAPLMLWRPRPRHSRHVIGPADTAAGHWTACTATPAHMWVRGPVHGLALALAAAPGPADQLLLAAQPGGQKLDIGPARRMLRVITPA
jgi:hypothetical protein